MYEGKTSYSSKVTNPQSRSLPDFIKIQGTYKNYCYITIYLIILS